MAHGKNCNIYRLQDVHYYVNDPNGYDLETPRGRPLQGKARQKRVVAMCRKALHDACVSIPRSVKTEGQLLALAKRVGDAHGFDVAAGEYKKR